MHKYTLFLRKECIFMQERTVNEPNEPNRPDKPDEPNAPRAIEAEG